MRWFEISASVPVYDIPNLPRKGRPARDQKLYRKNKDLTRDEISIRCLNMPPRKQYVQRVLARFRAGTVERIAAVLAPNEDRADFIRLSVEREIERRERAQRRDARREAQKPE